MSDLLRAASSTLDDWRYCLLTRSVWIVASALTLTICGAQKAAPTVPAVVITLLGHGAAFSLATLALANRDQRKLAFARPIRIAEVLPQQGAVLLPAVVIYLALLALMLWDEWRWLPLLANGAPETWLYIGLGVIPANRIRRRSTLRVDEWIKCSAWGALPIIGLTTAVRALQLDLWQITTFSFAHNLLSVYTAVCAGAVYYGVERWQK